MSIDIPSFANCNVVFAMKCLGVFGLWVIHYIALCINYAIEPFRIGQLVFLKLNNSGNRNKIRFNFSFYNVAVPGK